MLVMCLEDCGGKPLQKWLKEQRAFTLDESLTLAINVTEILIQTHERNIIHKNINPSNIIFNPNSGETKIIDFGISTQMSKQHPTLTTPNELEGSLAYISPEQTGRMNCSLDHRTDHYSLGATLYQLFTGAVPFTSTDMMELIHCHIAKKPIPPIQINPDLPPVLSNLIMKLLEKAAEARYQSARGIKTDLHACLVALQETGTVELFTLARSDISDRLQIPQKLYGREQELDTLLSAFERVAGGRMEMMLVSGHSGTGKSVLVSEVHKFVTRKRGYLVTGKFDQLQRDVPYSSIVNALGGLVQQLLSESETELNQWKERLLIAVGSNGQVIVEMIPEIELIIGPQPAVPQLGPTESQNRFNGVFRNVIRAFCQTGQSLVIFLDDLQWVDSATLNLLEVVTAEREGAALLLVGAYRDNEVGPTHPLTRTLSKLREENLPVNHISLGPLSYENVNQLISESLHRNLQDVDSLTELVMRKTAGNPFFVNQFLYAIYEEELLLFVPETSDKKGHWQWDVKHLESLDITDNVVDLMTLKLAKLSESERHLLRLAACVGCQFDLDTLLIISETSHRDTLQSLELIQEKELVLPIRKFEVGGKSVRRRSDEQLNVNMAVALAHLYRFSHDRVQQAAYSLVEEEDRKTTHLQIGRLLLKESADVVLKEKIFEIANHFNIAADILDDDHERSKVAGLNLIAGNKASSSMASEAALQYFRKGISLLPENRWQEHYALALNLTCGLITSTYLTASYPEAEALCTATLPMAQTNLDRVRIYSLLCTVLTLDNRMGETLTTGLEALSILDIPILEQPPVFSDIEQLRNLPEMTNPEQLAAMSILVDIISCSLVTQSPLMMPLIHTMVDLILKHGNSSKAPFGYVWYGCTLCWDRTDIGRGYQLGLLALEVMDEFSPCEVETTVLHQFNSFIRHWCEHERSSINEFPRIVQVGKETGDIEYGTYVAVNYVANLLLVGEPLASTQEKQRPFLDWVGSTQFSFALGYGTVFAQTTQCLMNQGHSPTLLQGDFMDEYQLIPEMHRTRNNLNLFAVYAAKAMLSYFNGRFEESADFAGKTEQYEAAIGGLLPVTQPPFYGALALLKIKSEDADWTPDGDKCLATYQEKMRLWSELGYRNFQHKYDLVEAEKSRVSGNSWRAAQLYEKAIAGAKESGYLHEEALAYELAADFYRGCGMDELANIHVKAAHGRYGQWGAPLKVAYLEGKYPQLIGLKTDISTPIQDDVSGSSNGRLEQLDFGSIMKASLALSGEITLSRLLRKMMSVVVENSGAETGVLLLITEGRWFIEAQGHTDHSAAPVLQSIPLEESGLASEGIIHYVARTEKSVVLRNASQEGNFTSDAYIVKHRPKSVLCVPLVHQGRLSSILYFENNLATGAFSPKRLEVITLLSSQIATSIENSLLYSRMEEKVAERTIELEREIATRKRAETAASTANEAKTAFFANMSHELRPPMNVIIGFSELMGRDPDTTPAQRRNIDSINKSGGHLLSMINDVLDISKIEAGKIELNPSSFDLLAFLEEVGGMMSSRARGMDLIFTMTLEPGLVRYVTGDAGKIRQVLLNLLENAVKFTQEGGVAIRARTCPHGNALQLEIEVEDSGPGIPAEKLATIFEPFVQATAKTTGHKGSGLGLAISRSFVALMEGEIMVESELGKGSLFHVKLPLTIATAEDVHPVERGLRRQEVGLAESQPEWRILVVDDDGENRRLLDTLLSQTGFTVRNAENGTSALTQFKAWHPHLVWMDMRMPVMDGYEATRRIREMPGGDAVKILALTASVFQDQYPEIMASGCDEVLFKPFKASEILTAMERHLAVVYNYADESIIAEEARAPKREVVTQSLAELPKEWLDELQDAVVVLDLDRLGAIIDRVAERDMVLSQALGLMVERYEFDWLQALFDPSTERDGVRR